MQSLYYNMLQKQLSDEKKSVLHEFTSGFIGQTHKK